MVVTKKCFGSVNDCHPSLIKAETEVEQTDTTANLDGDVPKRRNAEQNNENAELKEANAELKPLSKAKATSSVVRSASFFALIVFLTSNVTLLLLEPNFLLSTKFTLLYFLEQLIIITYFDDLIRTESYSFIPKCILNGDKFTLCELCKSIEIPVLFGFTAIIFVALLPPLFYFSYKTTTFELLMAQMISSSLATGLVLRKLYKNHFYRIDEQLRNNLSVKLDNDEPNDANKEPKEANADLKDENAERKALRDLEVVVDASIRFLVVSVISNFIWIFVILDENNQSFSDAIEFTLFYVLEQIIIVNYFEVLVRTKTYSFIPKYILRGDKFNPCELCKTIEIPVLFGFTVMILFSLIPPSLYFLGKTTLYIVVMQMISSFLAWMLVIRKLHKDHLSRFDEQLLPERQEKVRAVASV